LASIEIAVSLPPLPCVCRQIVAELLDDMDIDFLRVVWQIAHYAIWIGQAVCEVLAPVSFFLFKFSERRFGLSGFRRLGLL
jgi:hypothetical protein